MLREQFKQYLAQTSDSPMAFEAAKAEGIYIYDHKGKAHIDCISGIGVSNLGHKHPDIVSAVQTQAADYMHLMVYGEYIQGPQVQFAQAIVEACPKDLNNVFFVNSGSEAIEGALKLAKRYTGRGEILAFDKAYHGSTHGALSIIGDEHFRSNYRPLLPGIHHACYNDFKSLELIDSHLAAVVVELVQAEAGVHPGDVQWLTELATRCHKHGVLLIIDEIQTGMGRCGELFLSNAMPFTPDIITSAKALGGGMPIGAFIASQKLMSVLQENPVLGHITTFGGHPVSCAAGLAAINLLKENDYDVHAKGDYLAKLFAHEGVILDIRYRGLMMALQFESADFNFKVIEQCMADGLLTDWFLFADDCLRIAPPLSISYKELDQLADIILKAIQALKA